MSNVDSTNMIEGGKELLGKIAENADSKDSLSMLILLAVIVILLSVIFFGGRFFAKLVIAYMKKQDLLREQQREDDAIINEKKELAFIRLEEKIEGWLKMHGEKINGHELQINQNKIEIAEIRRRIETEVPK